MLLIEENIRVEIRFTYLFSLTDFTQLVHVLKKITIAANTVNIDDTKVMFFSFTIALMQDLSWKMMTQLTYTHMIYKYDSVKFEDLTINSKAVFN